MRTQLSGPLPQSLPAAPAAVGPPMPAFDEQLDVSRYLEMMRRRWPLLLAFCLVTVGYGFLHYTLTTKEYQATAQIQIERKRLSLLAMGQAGWMEDWWNIEFYPTQYRLLRSRGMAERVVRRLRLWEHPAFGATATVGGETGSDGASETELARLASRVQGNLTVDPIDDTQLVELSYRSTSPELAAQIANTYAEVFIEWGIESRSQTAGQTSSLIAAQIETLRQEIEERQKRLNAYTSSSDFPLDPAGEALLERQQALEKQYNAVLAERISKEAAYREIRAMPPEAAADRGSGDQVGVLKGEVYALESEYQSKLETYTPEWPAMVELKATIDEKREQLERLVTESHQEAVARANAEYQKAKREEEGLERELRKLTADARLQNSAVLEYTNMLTQVDTRKELLAELVKRQSQTEVESQLQNSQESNVRIVDRAIVPSRHFRPSLERNLTTALLFGLMLGVGVIFLLEFLDRTIKSPEELEGLTGLPTLAVIPDIRESRRSGRRSRYGGYGYGRSYGYGYTADGETRRRGDGDGGDKRLNIELLPHHNPRLAVSEAYRSLRTALLLSSSGELKVIGVTSAEPGEGKTATTCNLGVVLAQLGRRVLVIDGDLRRPRMHKVFKVSNRLGVVNYLTGRHNLEDLFQPTEVAGLYVCPCGPIPPNPSELLASERMQKLVAEVRSRFDFVLIDTPPVLPVADAVILGPQTDGLVLCARAGMLQREAAKLCRERLRYAELKILGTVLNRYSESTTRYSKRYRYYGVYQDQETADATHSAA